MVVGLLFILYSLLSIILFIIRDVGDAVPYISTIALRNTIPDYKKSLTRRRKGSRLRFACSANLRFMPCSSPRNCKFRGPYSLFGIKKILDDVLADYAH